MFAAYRGWQGITILRYRRNIRWLPRYSLSSTQIPVSWHTLFIGRSFRWEQRYTQRLLNCRRPEVAGYIHPGALCDLVRATEKACETRLTVNGSVSPKVWWISPLGNEACHYIYYAE